MYKIIFLCIVTLFLNKDVAEINWNEQHRLEWEDFQGQPDHSSDAAAVTASGISFSYSIKKSSVSGDINFTTEVGSHFYPESSWFKENVVDSHILAHEQLHFDITELNVRKFRKRLSKIKPSEDLTIVLQREQNRANKALSEMQNKYDFESNYSINESIQEEWIHFVKLELAAFYEFRSKS